MRRALLAALSVAALGTLIVSGVVVVKAYTDEVTLLPSRAADYQNLRVEYDAILSDWPYPLPAEDALPTLPPPGWAGSARTVVSEFFRCAWENAYVHGSGTSHDRALEMLGRWAALPPEVSTFQNADGLWLLTVVEPALGGDAGPMTTDLRGCATYLANRVAPPSGTSIDKSLPPVGSGSAAAGLPPSCDDLPGSVPCLLPWGPDALVDHGPTTFAHGETILDVRGVPVAYLVAHGDAPLSVAERFGLDLGWLLSLNCARRSSIALYDGDVLNLSMYTVTTVGSQNGGTHGSRPDCLSQGALPPQAGS